MTLIVSQSNLPSWRAEENGATKGKDIIDIGSYYKIDDTNIFSFSRYSMIMSDFWDQIAEIADLNKVRGFKNSITFLKVISSLGWGSDYRGVPGRIEECQPGQGI